jgi:hypothetical protein
MIKFLRLTLALLCCVTLVGCATTAEPKWASDAEVARATYRHEGPAKLTLFTVIDNFRGTGAHAGLLINASQRVIFDPAGTWYHPNLPERNDVHFGMTDNAVDFYVDYHARVQYHVVIQELEVSPQVAEMVLQRALAYGAVPKAQCTKAITAILRGVPGFESIPSTWYPKTASDAFGKLPGVTRREVYDDDPTDNSGFIAAYGI